MGTLILAALIVAALAGCGGFVAGWVASEHNGGRVRFRDLWDRQEQRHNAEVGSLLTEIAEQRARLDNRSATTPAKVGAESGND
ncbi:hypothetical protein ACL02T_29835 [Pseudonocardia sp. RS010]|uniref:hypothetical protein n=1 Tax=Pseudonocardia sp. RS010 TaxID=3385979 RepID=UPI0039A223E6